MAAVLGVIAQLLESMGLCMGVWAVLAREPRLMQGALGLAGLSLVYGAAGEASRAHWTDMGILAAGAAVVAVLMWRSWPEGWSAWRDFRKAVESGRLGKP
jgi:hypothetical protein